jgi:hypothetical protein
MVALRSPELRAVFVTKIRESKVATGVSGGGSYADLASFLRQRGEDLWSGNEVGLR